MIDVWIDEYAPACVDETPTVPEPRDTVACPVCLEDLDRDCGTCGHQR